ncbi:RloB domain-containing protein [Acinetobacter haemolyticus]|uniref:RloB family protein n=1 Tax=Acinetobacter haemolyticus TaxID=29430 RepID=UPI001372FEEC|nr:RloB family protein [Acinetobacter haemolyticus]NAR37606.1 RloB domain-containing protein [Acinetobacter haemolyticus]NAR49077.1 RloB domain-containing protein [Acinetobacter haemolyticus]
MGTDDIAKKKILANRKAREDRKIASRSAGNRSIIPRILILTEGESEEIYFQELIDNMSLDTVFVRQSIHTDSVGIINEAIKSAKSEAKKGNEYTYIFCIFDLDTVHNKCFLESISKYKSKTTEIFPIYSFPCIEVFFCLHFEQCTRPFNATEKKSIGDTVKEYFQQNFDGEYSETNRESIKKLIPKHKRAIYNSQKLIEHQIAIDSISKRPLNSMPIF